MQLVSAEIGVAFIFHALVYIYYTFQAHAGFSSWGDQKNQQSKKPICMEGKKNVRGRDVGGVIDFGGCGPTLVAKLIEGRSS